MEDTTRRHSAKLFHRVWWGYISGNEVKNTIEADIKGTMTFPWSHAQDPESGHYYYYHLETGETQEEPPGYSSYITQKEHHHEVSGAGDNEAYSEN